MPARPLKPGEWPGHATSDFTPHDCFPDISITRRARGSDLLIVRCRHCRREITIDTFQLNLIERLLPFEGRALDDLKEHRR